MPLFGYNPKLPSSPTKKSTNGMKMTGNIFNHRAVQTSSLHGKENAHRVFSSASVSIKPKAKDLILVKPRVSPFALRTKHQRLDRPPSSKPVIRRHYLASDNDDSDEERENIGIREEIKAQHEESEEENDWYEGSMLLESLRLRRETAPIEEKENKLAVVEDLKDAFDNLGERLRSDLTTPLVKVLDEVARVHAVAEGTVDIDIRRGLTKFCETSDTAHEFRVKACEHLKENLDANQKVVKALFHKLQATYKKRDSLWDELNTSFEQCAVNALSVFDDLEMSIKQTETILDKKCRVINHESGSTDRKGVLKTLLKL